VFRLQGQRFLERLRQHVFEGSGFHGSYVTRP
jgi:hypothetical protein